MHRLQPAIKEYGWGRTDGFIPHLIGIRDNQGPVAEAWYGTYSDSTAKLLDGTPLGKITRLPYLLKIMAIAQPLSIQAHPSLEQARAGYARESAAHTPEDERTCKDDNHKPETIVALNGGLIARAGIREPDEILELAHNLGVASFVSLIEDSRGRSADALPELLSLSATLRERLIGDLVLAATSRQIDERHTNDMQSIIVCNQHYPNDIGVAVQLLMNYVRLDAGQALHITAGELHAYLYGNGIEIMACSDNVVRAGLTPKHKNIDQLFSITNLNPRPPHISNDRHLTQNPEDYILDIVGPDTFPIARPTIALNVHTAPAPITIGNRTEYLQQGEAAYIDPLGRDIVISSTETVFCASAS